MNAPQWTACFADGMHNYTFSLTDSSCFQLDVSSRESGPVYLSICLSVYLSIYLGLSGYVWQT